MSEAETITIPRAEYDALRAAAEELEDVRAYDDAMADREEGLPLEFMKRLIEGESPVRVFREFRGFTASSLAAASGVNRVQIINIEAGRRTGSVQTLAKLAEALGVKVDDLIA